MKAFEGEGGPLWVEQGGAEKHGPHLHRQAELICVTSGELRARVRQQEYSLRAGDIAIIFPNVPHGCIPSACCAYFTVRFEPEWLQDYRESLLYKHCKTPVLRRERADPELFECLKKLADGWESRRPLPLLKGYLCLSLAHLLPGLELLPEGEGAQKTAEAVLLYIACHFNGRLSLKELAGRMGISRYRLSRIFSDKIGTSFSGCVNGMRVGYARRLLSDSSRPVTQIAYESGFGSLSSFNRVFKQLCGLSPSSYRQKCLNGEGLYVDLDFFTEPAGGGTVSSGI